MSQIKVFHGTVVAAPSFGQVTYTPDQLVIVNPESGCIDAIVPGSQLEQELKTRGWTEENVLHLEAEQLLLPGCIDTHVHAPQYQFTGTGTDKPLMKWLQAYTFPAELRLRDDLALAQTVYTKLVRRMLAHGTTTALYYGTIHEAPCRILADAAEHLGQRALVGKVAMDRHGQGEYQETTEESLASTESFIEYIRAKGCPRVLPVVTPRFIPTCTPELLRGLGALARKHDCHIQSHCSESLDEVAFVQALHPGEGTDSIIFDAHGLLTPKTVMAHGTYLSKEDRTLLRERGTGLAHCPLSNFYVGDGCLHAKLCVQEGLRTGLGTDVAGGYSPSMFNSMRNCVLAGCSRRIEALNSTGEFAEECINYKEAFWLATVGSAQALRMDDSIGALEAGKQFDALVVDTGTGECFDLVPSDSQEDKFQKFVHLGDDRCIKQVWVAGQRVK